MHHETGNDQRAAAGSERRHAVGPRLAPAKQAQHHQIGLGRQVGDQADGGPLGVGGQVAGPGSGGRQQFGIGGGNQENGEHLTDTAMRGDSELGGHSQPRYRVAGAMSKNPDRPWLIWTTWINRVPTAGTRQTQPLLNPGRPRRAGWSAGGGSGG